jgi:NAD(P)-dependent dehydrogenase (short-subunit alcohol dehydrogenase family)
MASTVLEGKVALITGASSGIGAALAREYARRGADAVLLARRVDRLEEVAESVVDLGRRALALECDVTAGQDLERAAARAVDEFGRVDRVIANAGFGVASPLAKLTLDDFRRQFETNVYGVLRTVYATRDALVNSRGCLGLIGSVSGFLGTPGSSPYCMSKAAVHLLGDCLRHEMAGLGVSVTIIVPGFVESEIRKVNNSGVYRPEARESIPKWLPMPAGVAARKIVAAVERRRRMLVLTGHGRLAVCLQRCVPGLLHTVIRRMGGRSRRDKS